ncbi:MAG TPA: DASS family sodium-coupled anion symporter [Chitinophagaceae bacterium]|nr:DASS family sodium-coupled anion symporter [Chitinophagaceae bacterium]
MNKKNISLILGPVLFLFIYLLPLKGLSSAGQAVLATTAWVAVWWIGEATELAVTSLLPILLLPLAGGLSIEKTTAAYAHPYIFLFMGGFMIGLAIERWNLHKRIAFSIINYIGKSEKKVIVGFMVATAFLSMWISNTATTLMMFPIALSVIENFKSETVFSKNLMLGIAYSASIGGMATLIGTPPNIILAGIVNESLGMEISFFKWMLFALPFACILLLAAILYLTSYKTPRETNDKQEFTLENLGKITVPEKRVLVVFSIVAFLWITRSFIWEAIIPGLNDTIIAMGGAFLLFLIPAGEGKEQLMNWDTAKKLPWDVLLIFGAGLAIAAGFSQTDLSNWLAGQFLHLKFVPSMLILLIVIAGINFLTEVTSNTATASMALPLMATLGYSLGIPSIQLMIAVALSASCAYMLPVSTPPNAIVFASGRIKIIQMVSTGFVLNIISIILIFFFVSYWWPVIS